MEETDFNHIVTVQKPSKHKANTPHMFRTLTVLFTIVVCIIGTAQAQFTISGEFRPRAEYRHGFKTLPEPDQDPAFFIDQRTRLNLSYSNEKYDFKIVIQDVRTWGSQPQLADSDGRLTTIHEAWARVRLSKAFAIKAGRQEIVYDDHRIFGNVDWAQQARSHDAAILIFKPNVLELNLGLAYNQDAPQLSTTFYTVPNSYKTFQYLWGSRPFGDFKVSALILNNGKQGGTAGDHNTYFSQTFGSRVKYNGKKLKGNFAVYKQTGAEPDGETDINASYLAFDMSYAVMENTSVAVGAELLSGNSPSNPDQENNAFNPFYGTNHKFNGLMDYFYVGNHINSVGLQDAFIRLTQKSGKLSTSLTTHFFSSEEHLQNALNTEKLDKYLGTEMDLVLVYNANDEINLQAGYSHMLATDSMEALKGGHKNETSNWAWLMLTVNPQLFTTKKDEENSN